MDFDRIPVLPPPPGKVSNFVNPSDTLLNPIIAVSAVCMGCMIPIAALRLFHRACITRAFWWDDVACVLAVVASVTYTAVTLDLRSVTGRHMWDIPISAFTTDVLRKHVLVYEMLYGPAMFFAKLSLFLLYLWLFGTNVRAKWFIWVGIISSFVLYAATTIAFGYYCIPRPSETWQRRVLGKQCEDTVVLGYVQGGFSVASDFYLLILPMPFVWALQMPRRKKIGISAVFMLGFLACVASVMGMYFRYVITTAADNTWYLGWTCMVIIIETSVGIICGCAPHLVSFFRRYPVHLLSLEALKKLQTTLRSKTSKQSSSPPSTLEEDRSSNEAYLKTGILGSSVRGEGAFLKSGDWSGSKEPLEPMQREEV